MADATPIVEPLAWGVAANIAVPRARHFAVGAKVWVSPWQWGDGGERLAVIGHHRGRGQRLIKVVIARKFLTGFRVKGIYSPAVYALFAEGFPGRHWRSKAEAEGFVSQLAPDDQASQTERTPRTSEAPE